MYTPYAPIESATDVYTAKPVFKGHSMEPENVPSIHVYTLDLHVYALFINRQ
jgi:hypothetical protein